jgi:hypothetical protein
MKRRVGHRLLSVVTAAALLFGMLTLAGPGTAGACEEEQVKLTGTARSYVTTGGERFIDGIITNTTTHTISANEVKLTWAEAPGRVQSGWICGGLLAPGEWASFHFNLLGGIATTWTPTVECYAYLKPDAKPLDVEISDVATQVPDAGEASFQCYDNEARIYTATVTNNNTVPVSSIDIAAVERDGGMSAFIDSLDTCDVPESLQPGESAQITFYGYAPYVGSIVVAARGSALEQPTLNLSVDNDKPNYGYPVTFSLQLLKADGSAADGECGFALQVSEDGEDWCEAKCIDASGGGVTLHVRPDSPTYFRAVYWGGDVLGYTTSNIIRVEPVKTADQPTCPGSVLAGKGFKVAGRIDAGAKSRGKAVKIIVQRKRYGRWVTTTKTTTKADVSGKYSKKVKLFRAGSYRIRAYRSGVGYTPYKSLKVHW